MKLPNIFRKNGVYIHGGVSAPHHKNTAESETVDMPIPDRICLIMQQHIGAPCVPCVKKGDSVLVGSLIGDSDKPVSAPIYSPVSGTVAEITNVMISTGAVSAAVVIETDKEQKAVDFTPPAIESREDLIAAVRQCGLVGLGGAGFPTHIKLNPSVPVDTLVVNGAECEPYITSDYREMVENTEDIIRGICLIIRHLGLSRAVVVVEDNKPLAIEQLIRAAKNSEFPHKIEILPTKAKYPRGAEKVTVYAATGRKIKPGALPADAGCIVMNVTSVGTLARYAQSGVPLLQKRITVDGSAVNEPKNLRAPIGTYIHDVIDYCGGYKSEPKKLIMGGPMMGVALPADDMPIMKQTNAILALDEREAYPKDFSACIRCGRCVRACPMSLLPVVIEGHLKLGDRDALEKDGVMNCIECGCCAYECPAMRPLVQVMRQSKMLVRKK